MIATFRAPGFRQHVGAVEGVEEARPAGVGGVQGVAGIVDRHDQLWPGDGRDLRVDALGPDCEVGTLGNQVVDLLEEGADGHGIGRLARAAEQPAVDPGLEVGAAAQEPLVPRAEVAHDLGEQLPDRLRWDARPGSDLPPDEVVEDGGDAQAGGGGVGGHEVSLVPTCPGRHHTDLPRTTTQW